MPSRRKIVVATCGPRLCGQGGAKNSEGQKAAHAGDSLPTRLRQTRQFAACGALSDLDARQVELDALAADLAKRLETFHAKEGDVARRELAVAEREQKADAGFADKAKALADDATRQHQANHAEAERLAQLATALAADRQAIENKKADLTQREQAVIVAEVARDAGFADERAALDTELRGKRAKMEIEIANTQEQRLSALEGELVKLKTARLGEVSKAEQSERDRIRAEIAQQPAHDGGVLRGEAKDQRRLG